MKDPNFLIADLLQYFLPPGIAWFKIHEYCNSLNFYFTMTAFALAVLVLDKSGSKHFSFKHDSIVLYIHPCDFQVLATFKRPHLPPTCAFQESLTNLVFTVGQNEAEYGASQHNAAAQAQIRIAQIGRARFLSEAR